MDFGGNTIELLALNSRHITAMLHKTNSRGCQCCPLACEGVGIWGLILDFLHITGSENIIFRSCVSQKNGLQKK